MVTEKPKFDRCNCCGGGFDSEGWCPLYCEGRVVDGECEIHAQRKDGE